MIFKTLDLDKDGFLSRADVNNSAKRLKWSWQEAPLLAVLDLLSVSKPIPESEFSALIHQIKNDPMGPYGKVLLKSSLFLQHEMLNDDGIPSEKRVGEGYIHHIKKSVELGEPDFKSLTQILENTADSEVGHQYQLLLDTLEIASISIENTALLVIDPQRSFTKGAWMQSIGRGGEMDILPIRLAFENCSAFLNRYYGHMEIMFTRCPFPASSYGWAQPISDILDQDQLYFIKPGNSVLFPQTNGFKQWINRCMDHGIHTLVIGGCTLNSCVRVSSIETFREFQNRNLQVVVDLSLSGARTRNYIVSSTFNGPSAVESAVIQMLDAGIEVVQEIEWK